jgi:ornithine carbamoyltransferase
VETVPPPARLAKDFLSILDLGHADLERLLALAAEVKAHRHLGLRAPAAAALAGRHIGLLFEKPSLRTHATFEVAIRELGGNPLNLPAEFAGGSREPIEDVARNLERWVHGLVVRTYAQEKVETFARSATRIPVINALTDEHHPLQAIADVMTMRERWGRAPGRVVAYVGDGNNVATSLAHASCMAGVSVHVASPKGYELPQHVIDEVARLATGGAEIRCFADPNEAVTGVNAIYTDVWASMGEENEAAARRLIFAPYQVNDALMSRAASGAMFMHCLPAHRGDEVTAGVIESSSSVVFDQAENRLHTQKALLLMLLAS